MNAKVFTIEQARSILPQVREVVDELRALRSQILETRRAINLLETLWGEDVRDPVNPDAEEYRQLKVRNRGIVRSFRTQSEELSSLGCHVKDLDLGIVGFFHIRDGMAVFMSWRVDDEVQESYEEIAPNARVFSLDEARDLLPRLREVFVELDEINVQLSTAHSELHVLEAMWSAVDASAHPDGEQMRDLRLEIQRLVESGRELEGELHGYGCQLKDFHEGLVDFYHVKDGQIVFLCWRRDEPDILAWHHFEAGFAGRHSLTESPADHQ